MSPFPRALEAPRGAITPVGEPLIARVIAASRESPRRRMVLPLHKSPGAVLQRMLNALQPGSYVRPHKHATPRAESLVLLRGVLRFVAFDEAGEIRRAVDLRPDADLGVDLEGDVYHTTISLAPDSVVFEVKTGPFDPATDKIFAPWAPEEASPGAEAFLRELIARTNPRG
ncbi:MAG TPA: WbuC family cupin fold metalloprotein [Gemmatimonadales bacterium]|nr:WbuC family cupin fold metalloprotein [Gemmatimonadales bacterium]